MDLNADASCFFKHGSQNLGALDARDLIAIATTVFKARLRLLPRSTWRRKAELSEPALEDGPAHPDLFAWVG
jgi:hypothetical protein